MNKKKIWCPYTGAEWEDKKEIINVEHIIPLSLGGHNSFTIKVNKEKNREVGTELDTKVVSFPLVLSARRHYGLIGHHKTEPKPKWPAKFAGLNGTINLAPEKPVFGAFRSKNDYGINFIRELTGGETLESKFTFDSEFMNLIFSFGCKLALGASYFLFGDIFKNFGYHDELRKLMNSKKPDEDHKFLFINNKKKGNGFWVLSWPNSLRAAEAGIDAAFIAICEQEDKHIIFTAHGIKNVLLGISLFGGLFRWYFSIAKDPLQFPIGGEFELGSVIEINLINKNYIKTDMRNYLIQFAEEKNFIPKGGVPID